MIIHERAGRDEPAVWGWTSTVVRAQGSCPMPQSQMGVGLAITPCSPQPWGLQSLHWYAL